jgi:hypothetical protein
VRLKTVVGRFHQVELPDADFLYAGLSLPFCAPDEFADVWRAVTQALRAEGALAGHFFGPHDSWASTSDMTFQTREELEVLFTGFDVRQITEQDEGRARGDWAQALARVPRNRDQTPTWLTVRRLTSASNSSRHPGPASRPINLLRLPGWLAASTERAATEAGSAAR